MAQDDKGWTFDNPMMDAWLSGQQQMFDVQKSWLDSFGAPPGGGPESESVREARGNWKLCERQLQSWMKASGLWGGLNKFAEDDADDIASQTLRRMLEPASFLNAGSDQLSQSIHKLIEGPEFADIGTLERQGLKTTREWLALREASAAHQAVTTAAWSRAFVTFSEEMVGNALKGQQDPQTLLARWLEIANTELVRTARSDAYLKSQRDFVRAGAEYHIKERELVEAWCEARSMPTRTEVDDLHRIATGLRREVRALRKQVKAMERLATAALTKPDTAAPNPASGPVATASAEVAGGKSQASKPRAIKARAKKAPARTAAARKRRAKPAPKGTTNG